jgi:KaiC/GvpD/RAD55 family RecA-like ATPase
MSLDRQVLDACIDDRKAYERVKDHINPKDFTPPIKFWWGILNEYYGRDNGVACADRSVLRELGAQRIPNPKHRDTILGIIDVSSVDSSIPNIVSAVLGLRRYNSAAEFAAAAMAGDDSTARDKLVEVNDLWERDTLSDGTSDKQYATGVEDLFNVIGSDRRIPILPVALNERIGGGVMEGHNILIFGRTEVGKSTFAINMAAGLVRKGHRVLYVGNEDGINALKGRFVCRLTGRTWAEVEANRDEAARVFRERGGEERLRLVHMQPGTVGAIAEDIEQFGPKFVFVDQIRNLASDEDGMTQRLEHNAIRFRNLISKHGVVGVAITQAGDRSQRHNEDSPVWLSSGDVDSSRVGLPAQMDLIIGIGGNSEMIQRGQRSISIVKNKLASDSKSREGFIVGFDLQRSGCR